MASRDLHEGGEDALLEGRAARIGYFGEESGNAAVRGLCLGIVGGEGIYIFYLEHLFRGRFLLRGRFAFWCFGC